MSCKLDFSLAPACIRGGRSSEMFGAVGGKLVADVSGLNVILLAQSRGEMAVMLAVTAILLHYSAVDTGTDGSAVSSG